jgi:hypothetical protein
MLGGTSHRKVDIPQQRLQHFVRDAPVFAICERNESVHTSLQHQPTV